MNVPLKRCKDCGQEFPATPDYFNRTTDNNSGLNPRCKSCRSVRRKAEYRNNPALAEKIRQRVKFRYWNDPERARETARQYAREHATEAVQRVAKWRKANPDKYKRQNAYSPQRQASAKRRRARKANADGSHTLEDVQRQYDYQHGRCFWCSSLVEGIYHADHVIPLSRGGSDSPGNIVIACPVCNGSKQDKLPYTDWTPPNPLKIDQGGLEPMIQRKSDHPLL